MNAEESNLRGQTGGQPSPLGQGKQAPGNMEATPSPAPERTETKADTSPVTPPKQASAAGDEPTPQASAPAADQPATPATPGPAADQPATPATPGPAADQPATSASPTPAADESAASAEPPKDEGRTYKVGQRLWGKVIKLSDTHATIGLGEHELDEGTLDLLHLRDDYGNLSIAEGDGLQVYVVGTHPHIKLATSLFPPASEVLQRLREAKEKNLAVRGRVAGINRGGLDVLIEGRRAFCPFSQIEIGRCEKPEIHLNHILDFKVIELDEEKKKVVLSRREILLEERKERAKELRGQVQQGAEFDGVVMRLQPFGAFVDIGGIDGLVHISEIAFDRIQHPSEVLKVGEKVRVKVMEITRDRQGRERIRLSMKALLADPWTAIEDQFHEGDIVVGKVVRVTDFGAFVKIHPGIEGLLHVSQYKPRDRRGAQTPAASAGSPAAPAAGEKPQTVAGDAQEPADQDAAAASPPEVAGTPAPDAKGAASPASDPQGAKDAKDATAAADEKVPVVGQEITVKISRIEAARRRVSLVLREEDRPERARKLDHDGAVGDRVEGVVRTVKPYGVFLDLPSLGPWVSGLLPGQETGLAREANLRKQFPIGDKFEVEIIDIDDQGRIRLSRRNIVEAPEGGPVEVGGANHGKGVSTAPPGGFNVLAEAIKRAQEQSDDSQ